MEDSSPDGTYEVALALQKVFGAGHLKILKRAGKLGLGSAYIDGLKLVSGNFVFLMDADLSHHVRFAYIRCTAAFVILPRLCCSQNLSRSSLKSRASATTMLFQGHAM